VTDLIQDLKEELAWLFNGRYEEKWMTPEGYVTSWRSRGPRFSVLGNFDLRKVFERCDMCGGRDYPWNLMECYGGWICRDCLNSIIEDV